MKKRLLPLLLLLPILVEAQQIPLPGILRTTDYLWNPAFAGSPGRWGGHASYNQQWIGFEGAPVTTLVGGHVNFKDYGMGLAADIIYDATGPLTFAGLAFAYRYQINPGLFTDEDRLSFGLSGVLGQRRFDPTRAKVSDANDPYLSGEAATSLDVNAGAGILYRTVTEDRLHRSHFFAGLGVSRLIPNQLMLNSSVPFGNRIHGNAVAGWRTARDLYFDHTMWVLWADPNLYNVSYQFKVESPEVFWAGLNLSTNFNFGLESGVILDGSWINADEFRIGAMANYHVAPSGAGQGLSMGIYFEVVR